MLVRGSFPPANEVWGKVMFLHLCVILFTGVGGWLPSMHHLLHDQEDMHPVGGGGLHPVEVCIQGDLHPRGDLHPGYYAILYSQLLECILVKPIFPAASHLLYSPKINRTNLYKDLNISDSQANASLTQLVKHWTLKQVIISCIRLSPTGGNFFCCC